MVRFGNRLTGDRTEMHAVSFLRGMMGWGTQDRDETRKLPQPGLPQAGAEQLVCSSFTYLFVHLPTCPSAILPANTIIN